MTLEEAIKHCIEVAESKKRQVENGDWEKGSSTERRCLECAEEHRQLAKWLKELKAYRENTCGDAISRQAAIKAIEALQRPIMREESNYYQFKFSGMSEALGAVENLPSVIPQRRTGRWEEYYTFFDPMTPRYRCSICQKPMEKILDGNQLVEWWSDYCPNCGTKMEVEE